MSASLIALLGRQKYTNGAAHTYGLAGKFKRVTGIFNTEVIGFMVEVEPLSDDTDLVNMDGVTTANIKKESFVAGQFYPLHCQSLIVGTGGTFIIFEPE